MYVERIPPPEPAPTLAEVPEISVVVPVYRGAECLSELHDRLTTALRATVGDAYEIMLVEDCGPDDSWSRIKQLAVEDPRVRGQRLSRNFGQHNAITAGLAAVRGNWIVVMDCDLQDRPEEIPRLYAKAKEGFDCVLARRRRRRDRWSKRLSSVAFYRVFNYLTDLHYDGTVANFSIVSRSIVREMLSFREQVRFYGAFLTWMGFRKAYVDVDHGDRFAGESSYTFIKLIRMALPIILSYSNKPLHLCIVAGLAISMLAFAAGLYVTLRALLLGIPVAGWASLIVSIYFSTGIILAALGVLGLYVDRIFVEVKNRPLYIVAEQTPEPPSVEGEP